MTAEISWTDIATALLATFGGISALVVIAGALARKLVNHHYEKALAVYKSEIAVTQKKLELQFETELRHRFQQVQQESQHELGLKMASFQSSLDEARGERSVAFGHLYEKREKLLLEMWGALVDVRDVGMDIAGVGEPDLQKITAMTLEAMKRLDRVEFYFPAVFVSEWHASLAALHAAAVNVVEVRRSLGSGGMSTDFQRLREAHKEYTQIWGSSKETIRRRIQELIRIDSADRIKGPEPQKLNA